MQFPRLTLCTDMIGLRWLRCKPQGRVYAPKIGLGQFSGRMTLGQSSKDGDERDREHSELTVLLTGAVSSDNARNLLILPCHVHSLIRCLLL